MEGHASVPEDRWMELVDSEVNALRWAVRMCSDDEIITQLDESIRVLVAWREMWNQGDGED